VAAATNPEARPRFYEVLGRSDLFVIDESPGARPPGQHTLAAGAQLQLRKVDFEGVPHLPVFSSATRISAVTKQEVHFVAMKASALFEIFGSEPLLLNPGSQYGKQLTPEEISGIRNGSIFSPRREQVVSGGEQVMLGQPSAYPSHVTDALCALFKTRKAVRAAYLAHAFFPQSGQPPHTMIGVDVEAGTDYDGLMGEVGTVLEGVTRQGELVDVIKIDAASGISTYMTKETKPFYRKRWLGLL
jgi:hypothetical protein